MNEPIHMVSFPKSSFSCNHFRGLKRSLLGHETVLNSSVKKTTIIGSRGLGFHQWELDYCRGIYSRLTSQHLNIKETRSKLIRRTSSYLVTASDDESIRLYDVASASCLKTINSKKYGVDLVCFTSHPTTVIYSSKNGWDEFLRLLSLNDNKYLRVYYAYKESLLQLTERGMVFAIAFGGYIWMLDACKYEKRPFNIFSVGDDVSKANVIKFSNDGRLMLLTTSDGHIHVLDSFRGTLLSTYNVKPISSNSILEASFNPEGMFVISGSGDGSVYAWNVRSGKEVASWMSSEMQPPVVKWAPGSLMFATGYSELSFWIPDLSKLGAYDNDFANIKVMGEMSTCR